MNTDSLTIAVLLDSLRAIVPDTVVESHVDTVAIPYVVLKGPSTLWNAAQLAVPIGVAILGWFWVNKLNREAQREHFFHEIVHSASQAVNEELTEYVRWCAWRAALVDKLYVSGAWQPARYGELNELLKAPVAHRWLLLIDGSCHVLDDVVKDLMPTMKSLGNRHSAIGQLIADAMDERRGLVERLEARKQARDGALSLGDDVQGFRLDMLRQVTDILKPQTTTSKNLRQRIVRILRGRKPGQTARKKGGRS